MIYYIKYNANGELYTMFDIEYYLKEFNSEKAEMLSEIHVSIIPNGYTHFVADKLREEAFESFNLEDFIKDVNKINNLRGLLYEWYDNRPRQLSDAKIFHNEFGDKFKKILTEFVEKYNLSLEVD
jgi:hypothetical protein